MKLHYWALGECGLSRETFCRFGLTSIKNPCCTTTRYEDWFPAARIIHSAVAGTAKLLQRPLPSFTLLFHTSPYTSTLQPPRLPFTFLFHLSPSFSTLQPPLPLFTLLFHSLLSSILCPPIPPFILLFHRSPSSSLSPPHLRWGGEDTRQGIGLSPHPSHHLTATQPQPHSAQHSFPQASSPHGVLCGPMMSSGKPGEIMQSALPVFSLIMMFSYVQAQRTPWLTQIWRRQHKSWYAATGFPHRQLFWVSPYHHRHCVPPWATAKSCILTSATSRVMEIPPAKDCITTPFCLPKVLVTWKWAIKVNRSIMG